MYGYAASVAEEICELIGWRMILSRYIELCMNQYIYFLQDLHAIESIYSTISICTGQVSDVTYGISVNILMCLTC